MTFAMDSRPTTSRLIVLTAGWAALLASAAPAQTTLYVDQHAAPPTDGLTWQTAYPDLQDALDAAAVAGSGVTQIRVAGGSTYKPDRGTGDRTATFQMVNGVAIYGGYAGLQGTDPDERDPAVYVTILSGDLAGDDGPGFTNYAENSHHVVTVPSTVTDGVNTLLDGLTIQGGNTQGAAIAHGGGVLSDTGHVRLNSCIIRSNRAERAGGMRNDTGCEATLTNCRFLDNESYVFGGGAMNVWGSVVTMRGCTFLRNRSNEHAGAIVVGEGGIAMISDCLFADNTTPTYGGAILQWGDSDLTLLNSVFFRNAAVGCGGAISSHGGNLKLLNCTMFGNSCDCPDGGGGIRMRGHAITVHNSILWGNSSLRGSLEQEQLLLEAQPMTTVTYSCIQGLSGALGGEWNIGLNPRFLDPRVGDLRLQQDSPAIDAGNNDAVPPDVTLDIDGLSRFMNVPLVPDTGNGAPPIVDMGAHETQPVFQDCNGNGVDDGVPNELDVCDYTPPGAQVEPDGGVLGDLDGDCDVDLEDFAIMQNRFTGPSVR